MFLMYENYLRFLYDSKKSDRNYVKGFSGNFFGSRFSNGNYWGTYLKTLHREPFLGLRGVV